MLSLIKDLISQNPFVEELEFQDRGIDRLDAHSVEILSRFSELRKISLQDNEIRRLPADLSQLAQIREINLSGNPLENLQKAVESLSTMPQLESLQINLHLEEEVDFLLRSLPRLQILNGLAVERDAIFSDEDIEQEQLTDDVLTISHNNLTINTKVNLNIPEDNTDLSTGRLTFHNAKTIPVDDQQTNGTTKLKTNNSFFEREDSSLCLKTNADLAVDTDSIIKIISNHEEDL